MNKKKLEKILKLIEDSKIICVTGQMASGKNYISSLMEQKGWKSIDADLIVHKAIELEADKIYNTFKKEAKEKNINLLINSNKDEKIIINRRALGSLLFNNPELLKKQEQIVYPKITEIIIEFTKKNPKTIINATVLYKTPELLKMCNQIIYVKAGFIKRIIRSIKRDKLPISQIIKRFKTQKNLYKEYKKFSVKILIVKN